MYYTVNELYDHFKEKIMGLGVNPKFAENPAFETALSAMKSLILQMGIGPERDYVTVREENGQLLFDVNTNYGSTYSMSISCDNAETIRCVLTEQKKSYFVDKKGKPGKQKDAIEIVSSLNKDTGTMSIVSNGSIVDNIDAQYGKCNNTTWAEKRDYTAGGVMTRREYKGYSRGELSTSFDNAKVDSMLYIPRFAFTPGFWEDKFEEHTIMMRDQLDTAQVIFEDRPRKIEYRSVLPLNQEHGLRDMALLGGYDPYPENTEIKPLSQEEIEEMIRRENNPKVEEDLRKYATGRSTYYYNSADDKYFVKKGVESSQSKSK